MDASAPPSPQITPSNSASAGNQPSAQPVHDLHREHCIHADVDDLGPLTLVPCSEHPGCQRRTIFGFKKFVSTFQKNADPYDYENKYQEDAAYQETGPNARVWRVAYEEATIVDMNRVTTWTDALDVLLVFAGLFSAVVSSFVAQTFQLLQIDNVEVLTNLLFESNNIQRAISEGISTASVPRSPLSPETVFHPSRTATWVNGLWFVSLSLSLTTALIAVVTKQWVHAYTESVQSAGTPRDRSRLRQLRSQNFKLWRVAEIIGMLPVLMHVALGIFFAGLIIFLLALSTKISFAAGSIVAVAVLAYFVTNMLPIVKPSCPYITPLTHFGYAMLLRLDHIATFVVPASIETLKRLKGWYSLNGIVVSASLSQSSPRRTTLHSSPHTKTFPSLRDLEMSRIHADGDSLDASTMTWLYTGSSNSSVQSIVLQALGNLSPGALPIVLEGLRVWFNATDADTSNPETAVDDSEDVEKKFKKITTAIRALLLLPEYKEPARRTSYERLVRSLFRVNPGYLIHWTPQCLAGSDSFCTLLNLTKPDVAGSFLYDQLSLPGQGGTEYDLVVWVQIVRNAFRMGTKWLSKEKTPEVWRQFMLWFACKPHACSLCAHDRRIGEVYRTTVVANSVAGFQYASGSLFVEVRPGDDIGRPMAFIEATKFLVPSLSDFFLELEHQDKFPTHPSNVPKDVLLSLALIQCRDVQNTSYLGDIDEASLAARTICNIRWSVGIEKTTRPFVHHAGILPATFQTLKAVAIDPFAIGALTLPDHRRLLHALYRSLVHAPDLSPDYHIWMTAATAVTIRDIVFGDSSDLCETGPLLVDIFECETRGKWSPLLPLVYERLCTHEWLAFIERTRFGPDTDDFPRTEHERSYHFLASLFVSNIETLPQYSPPVHTQVLSYIRIPENLLSMCKLFLFADLDSRHALWDLPSLVPYQEWDVCLKDLGNFLREGGTESLYEELFKYPHKHPHVPERILRHDSFTELDKVLAKLSLLTRSSSRTRTVFY